MKIANVKGMVAKLMMVGLAAGAFVAASSATAQAQQFAVGVQFGHPAYVTTYAYDRDGYRYYDRDGRRYYDRDDYRRSEAFREHEAREAFERRQAYLRHEQWEHEQWERAHHFDRDDYYRR
ncbi:MAG TPA: hypothetical protein VF865_00625 [Acidobacteriaceae bacterium]